MRPTIPPSPRPSARRSFLAVPALLGLLASAAVAAPIYVTLEDEAPGGFGTLSFSFDPALQGPAPYDYPDIAEYSGDYVRKEEDYRINVADYFRADMGSWIGYGFNWLLERYPRGLGIYEEYAELHFFGPAGQEMVLYSGGWTTGWEVGTPVGAGLWEGEEYRTAGMRIAALGDAPPEAVPEPGTLALLGAGLAAVALLGRRRQSRQRASR